MGDTSKTGFNFKVSIGFRNNSVKYICMYKYVSAATSFDILMFFSNFLSNEEQNIKSKYEYFRMPFFKIMKI